MPIYEYQCEECGLKFEELKSQKDSNTDIIPCRKCGADAHREMSSFSHSIAGGSPTESVDMLIGREANKRWQGITDRQSSRRGGKNLEKFDLPKASDNKYMPVMGLGTDKEKKDRKEYVNALQDHRKQRVQKGIPQFSEKGAF